VDEGESAAERDLGECRVTLLALATSDRGLVDPEDAVLRADDEALLRGRGAFETLRVYGGRPFRLEEHVDRLFASAVSIGLPSVQRGEFARLADAVLPSAGREDAVLRFVWTAGAGGGSATALALLSEVPPWIEDVRARGTHIVSLLGVRAAVPWLLPGVKSTSYAVNMAAEAEAKRRGADDAIFVDGEGIVLEGTVTNVWWRVGRTLCAPSLELGILAGVTRGAVLELAPGCGYEVSEGVFPLSDMLEAEEAFTSSSVRELLPIVGLDGHELARGPAADELQQALRALARP
jgi:4-amino-4-deoxychorismate lyase